MLDYENEALLELVGEDGLTIMAKGLGVERIFTKFLNVYSDSGNLVLVIGTSRKEEEIFIDWLQKENAEAMPPRIISSECNVNDRSQMYLEGGVLFMTSRILVVDLLLNRVPTEHVTGILVYKAHRLIESSQEAFILRLYREKNKKGFVKAFSESPQAFTRGFCQVERIMRNLFVQKLYLWPRFHATVSGSLEKSSPEVIEVHVKMSPSMVAIQMALLDLISICAKELKRCNPTVDTDEITVENAIAKSFDKIIRLQLDPIWNQLSKKTHQLVSDLQLLRHILCNLTQCDSVTFYNHISALRSSEKAFQQSHWLVLDSAEALFLNAKQRVFRNVKPRQDDEANSKEDEPETGGDLSVEENPKWTILTEVLNEVDEEFSKASAQPTVLILANEDQTSSQLVQLLCHGSKKLLKRLLKKTSMMRGKSAEPRTKPSSESEDVPMDSDDLLKSTTSKDIYVRCTKNKEEPFGIANILKSIWPRIVIMYDVELACIRQLEAFKARYPQNDLRVYFLIYADSVEEQAYLTTLRREKEAFDLLIKEKATMVVPEEQHGRTENNTLLSRDPRRANETVNAENTRHGGRGDTATEPKRVLVDMREFRSELPSLVHRRGIDIIPMTLEVGDYILSPEICVERKSISDLIGSLNSGRLYNQALAMVRHYSKPMLLIEFDQTKAFSLQSNRRHSMSEELSAQDFTSKLLLLTLHFPQLKLLWCSSPYATAELFEELKEGRAEPKVEEASAIVGKANDSAGIGTVEKYNSAPLDVLLKLPGVTTKNCYSIANNVPNLAALSATSQERIEELLGNSASAKMLWESLNLPMEKLEQTAAATSTKTVSWKRKRKRF